MRQPRVTVHGVEQAKLKIRAESVAIQNSSMAGLMRAGMMVRALAQKRVPVEYGNLRASAFTRKAMDGRFSVEVGFSAVYAVWVHENVNEKLKGVPRKSGIGHYWGPNGQSKFLESAFVELQSQIVKVIAEDARKRSKTKAPSSGTD